jgi:hypothetical protein
MSDAQSNEQELKWFEVEYLTNGYSRYTVDVQAVDEEAAEEQARDDSYAGLDSDEWWKELISVDEIPEPRN